MLFGDNNKILFKEEQHVSHIWLLVLLFPLILISWYGFFQQIVFGIPFGSKPSPNLFLVLFWLFFGILFPIFFYSLKMTIEVTTDQIRVKLFPVVKNYYFKEITSYDIQTYNPLSYGGWGIRFGALTLTGTQGIQLCLQNNKKMLIGSQHPQELIHAISVAIESKKE